MRQVKNGDNSDTHVRHVRVYHVRHVRVCHVRHVRVCHVRHVRGRFLAAKQTHLSPFFNRMTLDFLL